MHSQWPFGKPNATPGAYAGDRQHYEDRAYNHLCACQDKLTATGRLRKRVDPGVFKRMTEQTIEYTCQLIDKFPDGEPRYKAWLDEAQSMRKIVS